MREKGRKRDRERRRGREAHKMRHTLGEVETDRNREWKTEIEKDCE